MKSGARFITVVLASTVLVGAFLASAAEPASAAVPICFGKNATIVGTKADDFLMGTEEADVIVGLGGNDTIRGLFGDDRICGGSGNDRLSAGWGFSQIDGGIGDDRLLIRGGYADLWGAAGNDIMKVVEFGIGWAWYADAPSGVNVNLATGLATGDGTDRLIGIYGLVGTNYDDSLVGGPYDNEFMGLEGNDTIEGGGGDFDAALFVNAHGPVTVNLTTHTATGEGTDTLIGIEHVHGGSFDDVITGDLNSNLLHGGEGNDTISGLDANDYLFGEEGDDTLDGGNGPADIVNGGLGTDSCVNGEDVSQCESS
jgi:Ca2+-binding RTX toxin-like protein